MRVWVRFGVFAEDLGPCEKPLANPPPTPGSALFERRGRNLPPQGSRLQRKHRTDTYKRMRFGAEVCKRPYFSSGLWVQSIAQLLVRSCTRHLAALHHVQCSKGTDLPCWGAELLPPRPCGAGSVGISRLGAAGTWGSLSIFFCVYPISSFAPRFYEVRRARAKTKNKNVGIDQPPSVQVYVNAVILQYIDPPCACLRGVYSFPELAVLVRRSFT